MRANTVIIISSFDVKQRGRLHWKLSPMVMIAIKGMYMEDGQDADLYDWGKERMSYKPAQMSINIKSLFFFLV